MEPLVWVLLALQSQAGRGACCCSYSFVAFLPQVRAVSADGLPQWLLPMPDALDHYELLQRWREEGTSISSAFKIPGIRSSCFLIDWLHTADLGIAQDFLGSLFQVLLGKMPADTPKDRCAALFLHMQQYYRDHPQVPSKLDQLTLLMIRKKPSKPPKLRSRAGESRGLILFGLLMAEQWLDATDLYEGTMIKAAQSLWDCYCQLSPTNFHQATLKKHAMEFALLMSSLDRYTDSLEWRVKPKLHMFLHLTSDQGNPSCSWNYRDEDFGGTVACMFSRLGGPATPQAGSKALLEKFIAQNNLPWIE
jgi:5-carboxymethyl-2-hydroxymuconate isomerase